MAHDEDYLEQLEESASISADDMRRLEHLACKGDDDERYRVAAICANCFETKEQARRAERTLLRLLKDQDKMVRVTHAIRFARAALCALRGGCWDSLRTRNPCCAAMLRFRWRMSAENAQNAQEESAAMQSNAVMKRNTTRGHRYALTAHVTLFATMPD